MLLVKDLYRTKRGDQHGEENQADDDPPMAPGIVGSAPLKCKKQANDSRDKSDCAQGVQFQNLFSRARGSFARRRSGEDEHDNDNRDSTDRELQLSVSKGDVLLGKGDSR